MGWKDEMERFVNMLSVKVDAQAHTEVENQIRLSALEAKVGDGKCCAPQPGLNVCRGRCYWNAVEAVEPDPGRIRVLSEVRVQHMSDGTIQVIGVDGKQVGTGTTSDTVVIKPDVWSKNI